MLKGCDILIRFDKIKPIPHKELPDICTICISPIDDPLICISDTLINLIEFQPEYFRRGIKGATQHVYVRETVSKMLLTAAQSLPAGYKFKIYDAWRPAEVQKALFDDYYHTLCQENKDSSKSRDELIAMTMQFVSFPSADPNSPFVHSTGGAIDLTIVSPDGTELNMGTNFDDFTDAAHTAYFEDHPNCEVRENRRLLYNAMLAAGFTNYPAEWWHYDFGDRFWAATTGQDSIYQGIYTEPLRTNSL